MIQMNIQEARTNLSELIDKVVNGEQVVIARSNKPLVKLIPIEELKGKRKLGTAKGKIKILEDFNESLD